MRVERRPEESVFGVSRMRRKLWRGMETNLHPRDESVARSVRELGDGKWLFLRWAPEGKG